MNIKISKKLGKILKAARKKQNLTQVEVAKKVEMTVNYYAMTERGETNLTHDKISKLFKCLQLKAEALPI